MLWMLRSIDIAPESAGYAHYHDCDGYPPNQVLPTAKGTRHDWRRKLNYAIPTPSTRCAIGWLGRISGGVSRPYPPI
jgi:hypothetical protein